MGRAINYGDNMNYWILTMDTEELIVIGSVRSAENTTRPNLLLDSGEDSGELSKIPKQVKSDPKDDDTEESTQDFDYQDELEDSFPLIEPIKEETQNLPNKVTISPICLSLYILKTYWTNLSTMVMPRQELRNRSMILITEFPMVKGNLVSWTMQRSLDNLLILKKKSVTIGKQFQERTT